LQRVELTSEAIRLVRQLHQRLPEDGEIAGLLALMPLTDARRAARTRPDGELVPFEHSGAALSRVACRRDVENLNSSFDVPDVSRAHQRPSRRSISVSDVRTLMTGLVMGESPRWHNGQLYCFDIATHEVLDIDARGKGEVIARETSGIASIGFSTIGS
jgi:hypothetical protein